jgi:peptidoglycan/xylan/chitin deacetylase (PgdA/CDA1 family)
MDFLARRYRPIAEQQLIRWLQQNQPLPPFPALVTFDDGYLDNLDSALPVLRARDVPATLFLATHAIDRAGTFAWDVAAYCFHHTRRRRVTLPLLGTADMDAAEPAVLAERWIDRLKAAPQTEQARATAELPAALGVEPPDGVLAAFYLSWDQVRIMTASGVTLGAHTLSHPILSRLEDKGIRAEIEESKRRIEEETGQRVATFAYPSGRAGDFDNRAVEAVRRAGFSAAFTLRSGPTRLRAVRRAPMTIRRIFVSHKDSPARFCLKLLGVGRALRP